MLANMGGQIQVRVEVPEAGMARALARPRAPFLSLAFEEAIADFRARNIVSAAEFAAMEAEARQRAFTATNLATDSLREHAYAQIIAALENGTTLRDFAASLRSQEISLGVTPSDPGYLETIFRTNTSAAYNAGRLQQMASPAVLEARPYVQVRAIMDSRTTTICSYLNGLTFDRRNDPGWVKYAPPNHFQCRTTMVTLPASRVSASQVIRSSDVDQRGEPAPGFDAAPTLGLED